MSLRTSLQRLARRDPAAPSLRERLATATTRFAETKERAGKAAKVARILMTPPTPEAPPVPRTALVNYASWLFMERRLVCAELYPHLGVRAHAFVMDAPPANDFHFPPGRRWQDVPQPSTRAVKILDMIGVDWRSDTDPDWGISTLADTGERPRLPHGWPAPDADLLEALDDLTRLDAAQRAMYRDDSDREGDEVPGYSALEEARADALDRLAETRAESLTGLQAKARALLTRSVVDMGGAEFEAIAGSLARDLTGARQSTIEPRPDPIHAALAELERREAACAAEWERDRSDDGGPARNAAETAVFEHWRGVVLKTVPTTARGCAALARFARAFHQRWAASLDRDGPAVLDLIAGSPLL